MDMQLPARTLHLPQEVLDCIASHLRKAADISAVRLVNHAFCSAATELMLDIQQSPSELFTRPTDEEVGDVRQTDPKFFDYFCRQVERPLTIWTWLRVPRVVPLEDHHTEYGRRFLEHVIAPPNRGCLEGFYDDGDDGKDDVPQHSGRKATCYGRVQESSELFCIVIQWHSRVHWNAYRLSEEAAALRRFLNDVSPGCTQTSLSEQVPFVPEHRQKKPLFYDACEIRTLYFPATMTKEEKSIVQDTQHIRHFCEWRRPGNDRPNFSRSFACWLPGIRRVNGIYAAAVRIVFTSDRERYMSQQTSVTTEAGTIVKTNAELLEEELHAARILSSETLHCAFRCCPGWRN